jgi:[acyl-carrier-protein] S-malonyltransferase/trans-AT polyketide synthase/acyltransferase/oxidoreductase domain-containing protein
MGKDFHDNIRESRDVYEEASEVLGMDIAGMCFDENERLDLTEFTQPCILTTEIAMLRGLWAMYGFSPGLFGGHSLGEFTALVAAGVIPLAEALRIVHVRGRLMQEAAPVGVGGMSAVIAEGIDPLQVRSALGGLPIDLANVNSLNQIVISGEAGAMPEAQKRFSAWFGDEPFRFVPLNVSAPFHSRFMGPIEEPFEETLQSAGGLDAEKAVKVTSNFTGGFHSGDDGELKERLVAQLSNTVNWKDNMIRLASSAQAIYEIGPGRPLKEFFRTIGVDCRSITTFPSARRLFAAA